MTLCAVRGRSRGAHWLNDGTISFVDGGGLSRIGDNGGTPERIAEIDGLDGLHALPDGSAVFLSFKSEKSDDVDIVLTSTGERRKLLEGVTRRR